MTTDTMDYEEQRLQNIKDNEALLLSLGLAGPALPTSKNIGSSLKRLQSVKRKRATPKDESVYTPLPDIEDGYEQEDDRTASLKPKKKRPSLASSVISEASAGGLRRSGRATRSISRFADEVKLELEDEDDEEEGSSRSKIRSREYREAGEPQRLAKKLGVRTENPKQFGHIPGVEVGRTWASRIDCSTDAIHAPTVAGISGNPEEGAWSIALSGGYPDDVDLGVAFTYTGCGGRDLKGTKQNPKNLRTAEQTSDQSFDWPLNAAIKRSCETKKPVRVIRGFKLPSPYAPPEGYRYDGLYIVEKAWMGKGLTRGLKVCRYAFKRIDGQPPLPERDVEQELKDLDEQEGKK